MSHPSTSLHHLSGPRRLAAWLLLLICSGMLILTQHENTAHASPGGPAAIEETATAMATSATVTPTRSATRTRTVTRTATNTPTPSPTPDCDDWREWPNATTTALVNPIYGLGAAAPDDVWAVGVQAGYGLTNPQALIERWDGAEWGLAPVTRTGVLQAVAAVAPDDVWAVGYYEDPARTLTMHWDGSTWSTVPSPYDAGVSNNLYGVAAAGPSDVWAVGNAQNHGRILHWDGTQWNISPTPDLEYSFLLAVAVVGPSDVWAVGSEGYYDAHTLALHWDGSTWTRFTSPSSGTFRNRLNAVSVVSANDVWAAGWATSGESTFSGTILHWNGAQWSETPIQGSEHAENTGSTQLYGIAAESGSEAWAVGWVLDLNVRRNVILSWDGTGWTSVNSPNPSSYFNELHAVTVTGPGEAWAAGYMGLPTGGMYGAMTLRYGPQCGTPTPTITGTPPTATQTPTATNTALPAATSTAVPTACGVLFSESFETGGLGQFTSVVPICVPGGCDWISSAVSPHDGARAAFAPDLSNISDQRLVLSEPVVPAAGSMLSFWHSYDLESLGTSYFDGGVLEASTDGGDTWSDMSANIVSGGYNGTISLTFNNPLAGRPAWSGNSNGYIRSIVNLSPYAGQSLLFRFREGTDDSLGAGGWRVDNVVVTGGGICGTATGTPAVTATTVALTGTVAPTDTPAVTATTVALTGTPTAEPEPTSEACNIQFSDVRPGDTFYTSALCLACHGIVAGYPDGTFRPYNLVTRGQLAKIVSNGAGYSDVVTSDQTFEDVAPDNAFYVYVERVAAREIISGYQCGGPGEPCDAQNRPYFRPSSNATRGQIAKIVSNAANMTDVPAEQMFEDVPPDHTFYLWIERLAMHQMISGYQCGAPGEPCVGGNNTYFRSSSNATRGQVAKIVSGTFFPACQSRSR